MKYKVRQKDPISKECFVCGTENVAGLEAVFYTLEDERVVSLFTAKSCHEGHPGIMHGGVIGAILDETGGRAYCALVPDSTAYTIELNIKYSHTVPTNTPLIVVAKVSEVREHVFISKAELILPDGTVAATSNGVYYILQNPAAFTNSGSFHTVHPEVTDREWIDIPEK